MRRAARVDRNQPEILAALRKAGAQVVDLSRVGGGVPDLLCCSRSGRMFFVEVKTEEGTLTDDQDEFLWLWRGPTHIVRNVTEALRVLEMETDDRGDLIRGRRE